MTTATTAPASRIHHPGDRRSLLVLPGSAPSTVGVSDVSDLLDAAGPLSLSDIAGGLAVPLSAAAARVRQMVLAGQLRRDEFGRYRRQEAR